MPANTPRGYPYPLPTEPVAEGAQAIRNLADAVDAKTETLIETKTLAANGLMDFTIPQTFTDLRIVARVRSTHPTLDTLALSFNPPGGNYNYQQLTQLAASVAGSGVDGTAFARLMPLVQASGAPNLWTTLVLTIPGYRAVGFKSWLGQGNTAHTSGGQQVFSSGLWLQTAAITVVRVSSELAQLVAGSRATLYGLP